MKELNEFMRYMLKAEMDRTHEGIGQTVTSLCGALFPVMTSKLFTVEEREQIFKTWYETIKDRINDEAKEMDTVFMNMTDEDKDEVSGFYRHIGRESPPDGETVRVIGKKKLNGWVKAVRALLALEPL